MIITLTGTNSFSLQNTLQQLSSDFIAREGDLALQRLDCSEASLDQVNEAINSLPFLANKKMVVLRQPSANKQFSEQVEVILGSVPDTTEVIVHEPKLDKRSSYYKFLKKATDYREFNRLDPAGLARWLGQATKERGGTVSTADAQYLVGRVGANQQLLSNELDKLLLYAPQISRQTIDLLTEATPQSTVFELLEAAFAGQTQQALRLYTEQRAMKVEPQQIIAMLSWQLHIVALIKAAGQRTPEAIASEAKVSPYVVKKSLTIARKVTLSHLKQLVAGLLEIDSRSKTEAYNVDEAVQTYLVGLGGPA